MPSKNSVKEFLSDSLYHIYNRGVEKRIIFIDGQDYAVFLSYLKTYLIPKDIKALQSVLTDQTVSWKEKDKALKLLRLNNFSENLVLISYCLMPNHFHLLVKQNEAITIDRFMNSLCTRYAMYFNKKYKRVGVLFQDHYKAVRVVNDAQLMHLSRYIHRNPVKMLRLASQGAPLQSYEYSSYQEYLGLRQTSWISQNILLDYFTNKSNKSQSYRAFLEGTDVDERVLASIMIDEEEI